MKTRRFLAAVALAAVMVTGVFAGEARAEDMEKSAGADLAIMSNYVWRGLTLSDSWVVQPALSVGLGPVSLGMWSNYDGNVDMGGDEGDTGKVTETDLTVSYAKEIEKVSLEAGYIYYELEGYMDTQEIYASASYDFVVSPSLAVYYDFDEGTGAYAVLALSYSREVGKASVDLGVSASYLMDNAVVGVDANGEEYSDFHNGEVTVGVSYPVSDLVSVGLMAAYTFPLSDDAEDAIEAYSIGGDSDTLYGGLTVSAAF